MELFDRPRFVRSTQLQAACEKIPCPTLPGFLAKHFWLLHCVHHPGRPPVGSPLFVAASRRPAVWDNFDDRAGEQEAAYRVDQQVAKKAGKWKTRRFRLALPLSNLVQACAQITPEAWDSKCLRPLQKPASSSALGIKVYHIFETL